MKIAVYVVLDIPDEQYGRTSDLDADIADALAKACACDVAFVAHVEGVKPEFCALGYDEELHG